jgi:hypothetical protein
VERTSPAAPADRSAPAAVVAQAEPASAPAEGRTAPGPYFLGRPDAPLVMEEYSDFQ